MMLALPIDGEAVRLGRELVRSPRIHILQYSRAPGHACQLEVCPEIVDIVGTGRLALAREIGSGSVGLGASQLHMWACGYI